MNIEFNYTPNDKQRMAHSYPHRYKLYGGAVGGGKTWWLCAEAIFHALQYPGNRVLMCRKHLTDFKNSTLVTLLRLLPKELIKDHNRSEGKITILNGSVILYMGLGNAEEVEKLRSIELNVICIDEATEVAYEGFLMAQQRVGRWKLDDGRFPPAYVLLASNPDTGWVKEHFIDSPGEDFIFIQALPTDNIHLAEDYIPTLRKTYPEEWVKRFLEGDWNALSGGDKIIPYDWIQGAVNREIIHEEKRIVSCDPAAFGDDETVIYFGKGACLLKQDTAYKQDPMVTCGKILRMFKDNNAKIAIIENDGLGVVVATRCREMGIKVLPFQSGGSSTNKDKFFNLKTEAWFHARELFENGQVSIPNDPKLINQLAAVKYTIRDSGGRLWVEPKSKFKERSSKSPDRADALVLMLWATKHLRDPARDFTRKINPLSGQPKHRNTYGWSYTNA